MLSKFLAALRSQVAAFVKWWKDPTASDCERGYDEYLRIEHHRQLRPDQERQSTPFHWWGPM